jgi:integration host factor subunit alpha
MKTITKNSIAKNIFYEIGIPTSMATNIVNSVFNIMIDKIIEDKIVKIPKFGSFKVKEKSSRLGRNLNTGENVVIKPRTVVSFLTSEQLKKEINTSSENK